MNEDQVVLTPEEQAKEERDAFTAGYNKVKPEVKPEKEGSDKDEPEKTVITPDKIDAEPDPWEGISPIIKTTLGSITEKLEKVAVTANQVGSVQRHLKGLEDKIGAVVAGMEAVKTVAKTGADTPTQSEVKTAAQTTEKWNQIKTDFPEWAEAMEERLAAQSAAMKPAEPVDVEGLRKQLQDEASAAISQSAPAIERRAREYARVDLAHPDWEDDVYVHDAEGKKIISDSGGPVFTPEFNAWMTAQAPDVKALANSEKSKDAISMLDQFYKHKKTAAAQAAADEKRNKRLAAAVTPQQVASGGPTILPDEAGLAIGYKKVKHA